MSVQTHYESKLSLLDQRLHAYLLISEPPEHEELRALREATMKLAKGYMQIMPEQGHFLAFLARLIGARRTLEIGTFTGYSALAVALALPADGQIVACDLSDEWTSIGRAYWNRAGVGNKIDLRVAPALDTLRKLEEEGEADCFDLAFIDANKGEYRDYFESALRLVRPGGLIALDNTLRPGRETDANPRIVSLRTFNAQLAADDRVDRVMLPIAEGMTLARRRQ